MLVSSNNTSNSTNPSQQESQIDENATNFQSQLSTELPSVKPVEGTYTNNQSGIQVTFPEGWKGSEIPQGNITFLVLTPQLPSQVTSPQDPPPFIMLQISYGGSSIGSKISPDSSMGMPFSFEDIVNLNDSDLSKKIGCNFTTISSENVSINETAGKQLAYQCTYPSNPAFIAHGKALAIEKEENQIVLAYNTPSSTNFEKYLPEFDKVVQSLVIQ